jgi:hypothetical protein
VKGGRSRYGRAWNRLGIETVMGSAPPRRRTLLSVRGIPRPGGCSFPCSCRLSRRMDQLTIVALLASSGALAVASAKGVLVLVFRLMVRFSVPASNGANGSPSQA